MASVRTHAEEGRDRSRRDVGHIFTEIEFTSDFRLRKEALEELDKRLKEAPVDTREALLAFNPVADEFQREVVVSRDHSIRLVAPAGSGKTQTVINRVLQRIKEGIKPQRILVLTFDNSAATALHGALRSVAGQPIEGLRISTLNAYGFSILREHFPEEFKSVIPDYKRRRLAREIMETLQRISPERHAALPSNLRNSFYLEFFSFLKNSMFDPRQPEAQALADFILERPQGHAFITDAKDYDLVEKVIQALIWLFRAYEKAMERDRLLDFDDQKLRSFVELQKAPGVLKALQSRLTEVIVDEFQDINQLDFEFIKAVSAKSDLTVVGDDDQAIYGFRGCSPDFIIDLGHFLGRSVSSFELRINYRCPPNLVDHADRLIRHNIRRIPKNPIAHSAIPSQIKVASTLSAVLEAKSIVAFIKRVLKATPALDFSNFAVLYRTNAQSLPLQIQFILDDVPYYVRDEDNVLENEVLERLLGVLRLELAISGGMAPAAQDAVLSVQAYFRFINPREVTRLKHLFSERGDFLETLSSDEFFSVLPFARESNILQAMREEIGAGTLLNTLDVLTRRFRGLRGMIGSLEDVVEERVPLGEIYDIAAEFSGNVGDFVKMMDRALSRAKSAKAGKQEETGVQLLTYFKSKGRQWHTVVLTTCNQGLIPHKKAPIEDERRLFYVALTRASANLLVSYVKNVCNTKVEPSQFLREAGLI